MRDLLTGVDYRLFAWREADGEEWIGLLPADSKRSNRFSFLRVASARLSCAGWAVSTPDRRLPFYKSRDEAVAALRRAGRRLFRSDFIDGAPIEFEVEPA